jgi:ligand-binding SRPBCC domain-containing protein
VARIVRDVYVSCPPSKVFDVLATVERLTEFSEMTVEVKGPGRPVQPGDRFEQVVRVAGLNLETEWEVTEVERDSLIRVDGRSRGNGRATLVDRMTPEGDGTRVTLEVDYDLPWGILGEIADKLVVERKNEDEAEGILERLKQLCEGGAPLERDS